MANGIVDVFFNTAVISRYLPIIAKSLIATVSIAFLIIVGGLLLGIALAILRSAGRSALSFVIVIYVDLLRTLPPLVFIVLVYFGAPYLNITLSPYITTWLTLTVILSAYIEEAVWSGMKSLAHGQYEAARSTGLSWLQAMLLVVVPQALRAMIGPITSRAVSITKDTALGSIIGLSEMLGVAQSAASNAANASPLTITVLLYLALFLPVVVASRYLEKVWNWKR